ncbi:MoaD/ThiS family protein [Micromonospora inositola]|uniref:MoaD/ThiS family protein n=1 Tax=Micromonospora inositola TaxID=47865 RepID=UPI001E30DAA7|nr:MoaD/ThiS family protein [Micromonospora inositola]
MVPGRRPPARRALRPRRGGLSGDRAAARPAARRGRRREPAHRGGHRHPAGVLDELAGAWPRLARRIRDERGELRRYVNVYVDGEDCRHVGGLDTPVGDGAEVQVLPSVAGG